MNVAAAQAACLALVAGILASAPCALAQTDEDPAIRRAKAPAVPAAAVTGDSRTDRLEFNFGRNRGEAWLARTGELYVDIWVQHNGLLCSTYEVGVRFGHGNPGCSGVQWLSPAKYVTSLRQCNNAVVQHSGTDTDDILAPRFSEVTCAERMIRCVSGCR